MKCSRKWQPKAEQLQPEGQNWSFTCHCNDPSGGVFRRKNWRSSRHTDFPPVALRTLQQNRNISLFHHLTVADSGAIRKEATTNYHDRFPIHCSFRLHTAVLHAAPFLLDFLSLPSAPRWQLLPYEQMRNVYVPSHVTWNCSAIRQTSSLDGATQTETSQWYYISTA
jgi:hypothetical protein